MLYLSKYHWFTPFTVTYKLIDFDKKSADMINLCNHIRGFIYFH